MLENLQNPLNPQTSPSNQQRTRILTGEMPHQPLTQAQHLHQHLKG